jgi:hypothetical protein
VPEPERKHRIAIVSACMNKDGTPALALNEVAVTPDERDNGIHYYLAEAELLEAGYEEPFVHFDADEAPPFLHAAVREHLGLPPGSSNLVPVPTPEDCRCPE